MRSVALGAHLISLRTAARVARRQSALQDAMPQILYLLERNGVGRVQTLGLQVLRADCPIPGRVRLAHRDRFVAAGVVLCASATATFAQLMHHAAQRQPSVECLPTALRRMEGG